MWTIHDLRLKSDFKYYVEQKLQIPWEGGKFVITKTHDQWVQTVQDNPFTAIKWYRWWGKSKLFTFCHCIWRADMHNESAVILSANEELAFHKLDDIRISCEFDNEQLMYLSWKGVDGITWNRGEIWLIDRKSYITWDDGKPIYRIKAKIYAKGIFSNFRWLHVHNIYWDDIVVEDNSSTPEQREQLKKRFFAAALWMRLSRQKTHVCVIGTPQHPDDLLEELCNEKNTMWTKFIVPVMNEFWMPTCPELHDAMWIEEQRKLVWDVTFQQEYMLKPVVLWQDFFWQSILDLSKDIKEIMVLEYNKLPNDFVVLGTDFSVKWSKEEAENKDSDYFSLAVIRYNRITGKRKILNLYRDRGLSKIAQLNLVRIFQLKYNVDKIAMEWFVFLEWAKQDLSEDLWHLIVDTSSRKGKLDVKEWIPSLQYEFEKGMYIVPFWDDYSMTMANIFFSELKNVQNTKHDDVADAVLRAERAIRLEEGMNIKVEKNFNIYWQDRLKYNPESKSSPLQPTGYQRL